MTDYYCPVDFFGNEIKAMTNVAVLCAAQFGSNSKALRKGFVTRFISDRMVEVKLEDERILRVVSEKSVIVNLLSESYIGDRDK
ncbi:hypothetical protein PQC39_gp001 [Vibrio phage Vp_R1]|uniref:Uncharacterized protein n=1 Tax=Vibrio phage Vp_R1 TaxID=2059867 RepID=A0A2H5BPX7_9CAUD|nr:hypothetical protein PQC39_gp001 [Vibrio phage Vp_R1]AUG88365.1 hypothetical protein VPR_001 [Vibrio phage Vp_R1]